MSMLKKYDDLEDGKIYYTVKEKWFSDWKSILYPSSTSNYLSEEDYKNLIANKTATNEALLSIFTIPIIVSEKGWFKDLEFENGNAQEEVLNYIDWKITAVVESILSESIKPLGEYKNEISSSLNSFESFFAEYDEWYRNKIFWNLDILKIEIYSILDSEIDKFIQNKSPEDKESIISEKSDKIGEVINKFMESLPRDAIRKIARWTFKDIEELSDQYLYDKLFPENQELSEDQELDTNLTYDQKFRKTLLKLYEELNDSYKYKKWDELDTDMFANLYTQGIYDKSLKLIQRIESWEYISFPYIFQEYIKTFLKYYETEEASFDLELLSKTINQLKESFEDLLDESGMHPRSLLYNKLLELSQEIDQSDQSSSHLWESVRIFYNKLQSLWDSISIDLRKKVIELDKKISDSWKKNILEQDDPSDAIFEKLNDIVNNFFLDSDVQVKYSMTIEHIFTAFDDIYFSEKYFKDTLLPYEEIFSPKKEKKINISDLSAKDLFDKIITYKKELDENSVDSNSLEKLISTIDCLKKYSDEELTKLLSKEDLWNLESILSLDKIEDFEFAVRIRDSIILYNIN